MSPLTLLRPLHFMREITRVPVFVRLMDHLITNAEADLKSDKVAAMTQQVRELDLLEPVLGTFRRSGVPDADAVEESLRREFYDSLKESVDREFLGYRVWLINSGLVLVVAFLDSFLDELVRGALQTNPSLLLSAAPDRQVELTAILAAPSKEALVQEEIDRYAKKVGFRSIRERLVLLEKRLRIPVGDILQWKLYGPPSLAILQKWNLDRIADVYSVRHQVAHRGASEASMTMDDLSETADVFSRLVLSLSTDAGSRLGLPLDWDSTKRKAAEVLAANRDLSD